MTALAKNRDIQRFGDEAKTAFVPNGLPVQAAVKIFKGALVSNDGGNIRPARATAADVVLGVSEEYLDNSAGSAGDLTIKRIRRGMFLFANSASGDLITNAEVGKTVYVVDDQTVAKTDNSAARPAAGVCMGFEGLLVIVEVG